MIRKPPASLLSRTMNEPVCNPSSLSAQRGGEATQRSRKVHDYVLMGGGPLLRRRHCNAPHNLRKERELRVMVILSNAETHSYIRRRED